MPLVRMLRGWTGRTFARYGPGDVAAFSGEEAAIIVAAGAGIYASVGPEGTAAIMAPPQDKMVKEPSKMKAAR